MTTRRPEPGAQPLAAPPSGAEPAAQPSGAEPGAQPSGAQPLGAQPLGAQPPAARATLPSRRALLEEHDALLIDLDGVIYLSGSLVPGAADAVDAARRAGCSVVFVTNNAARSAAEVAVRLAELGVAAEAADVVTSAQAAAAVLASRLPAGARTLVVGTAALVEEIRAVGLQPVTSADAHPEAVVSGYNEDLRYSDVAEAALAIRAGALWVATNLDATIPTPRGLLPGNGATAALLERASGVSPLSAGKPSAALFESAVARVKAARPLMIGDRLDTDIAGAQAAGIPALLVLTGVASVGDLLTASPGERPEAVGRDIRAVLDPRLVVTRATGGKHQCGGWTAAVDADEVRLSGAGSYNEGVQAAAAAAWAATDEGGRRVSRVQGLPEPS